MALSRKTEKRLAKLVDSAATLQLATEHAADLLTYSAVESSTERLVTRVVVQSGSVRGAAWSAAVRSIQREQEQLQVDFTAAMLEARAIGQEFAMRQLALELEPVMERHALVLTPSLAPAEVEALWAKHAATGMARAMGTVAIGEAVAWKNSREETATLAKRLASVPKRVEAERKRHAVNQSVGAFNETKREKLVELKERGPGTGAPGIVKTKGRGAQTFDDGMREIWSAILDRKTCPVCWKLDGQMVKVGEKFHEGARSPVHGHCRCTQITAFIPEELEKYLAGAELDYEALKDDVKDYMGSHKFDVGEGVRHAKQYVVEVLERRGHSPYVLAERFNNRGKYFPNVPKPVVPSLLW